MLYYNRVDVSEGIDVNKTNASNECIVCHYRYFLGKGFKFQSCVCNGWHDVLMMSVDIESVATLNVHGVDYCSIIVEINKSATTNVFKCENSGPLWNIKKIIIYSIKNV